MHASKLVNTLNYIANYKPCMNKKNCESTSMFYDCFRSADIIFPKDRNKVKSNFVPNTEIQQQYKHTHTHNEKKVMIYSQGIYL